MSSDENLIAMNMKYGTQSVQYFKKQGKLSEEQYQQVSLVIKSLFKIISESQNNYNTLNETMRILKKQLVTIKHEYEAANNRQMQVKQNTEKLSRALKSAEIAYQSQKASHQNLIFEAEQFEKDVINREQKMRDDFRIAEEKMQPKIQRYHTQIQETKALNQKTQNSIDSLQRNLQQNMSKVNNIKVKNIELLQLQQKLNEIKLKIKDSPQHHAKSAQNLNIQILGMLNQLKQVKQELQRKQKICNTFTIKKQKQKDQISKLKIEKQQTCQECQAIQTEIDSIKNSINGKQIQRSQLKVDIMNYDKSLDDIHRSIKFQGQRVNKASKQCEKLKKHYKKEQIQKKLSLQIIIQNQLISQKLKKQQQMILNEMRGQSYKQESIKQDIAIVIDRTQNVQIKCTDNESKKKQIQAQIKRYLLTLKDLKTSVYDVNKEIKDSTAVRQSMARKASVALNEVRETKQDLKVRELLILDLSKKEQQTQNKLEHFKSLYQQVKSARNKYVNLIQNSSQDLAELKQRIKILQNELQILKNQSSQKNKTIQDYDHMLKLQIHKRDQTKTKLNKYQLQKRQKKQIVDQNINQIEKLNIIILSLQKDMQNLRQQYQQSCQNRNYTGIQLIDRNDQLCILYEKSNMQENIFRKAQVSVKNVQDQIRMIKIEIAEMDRKIKVAQQKLSTVPKYGNKVLDLQLQIQQVYLRQNQLSKQLQNPQNKKRWRQLQGEDPDEQALDAKISILEQRLNSKKEQLLQKQLILDEVSNLTEKLKKDAIDGRQSTLEISEKVNQFQSRLRDLTRKMKATISELSMCQANIIKYQNQRQKLEEAHDSAEKRMQQGLPPTPQTEVQYLKMIRDKKRYEQQRKIRMQKQIMQQNYPPFATKTTANQRVNSYIPDQIGLPKPYGNNAPFMYQVPGANMRHFRKPKYKEIQI